jgi:uncharacterized protein YkwD
MRRALRLFWITLACACTSGSNALEGAPQRAVADRTEEAVDSVEAERALDSPEATTPILPIAGGIDAGRSKSDAGSVPPPSTASCSLWKSGATGREAMIPVCCTPSNGMDAAGGPDLMAMLAAYRTENGRSALSLDGRLSAAAQGHCEHMRAHGFFSHFAPEPVVYSVFDRAPLCGAIADGEVLAYFFSAAEAMAFWKGSPAHNDILLGTWRRVGAARANGYWALVFGR